MQATRHAYTTSIHSAQAAHPVLTACSPAFTALVTPRRKSFLAAFETYSLATVDYKGDQSMLKKAKADRESEQVNLDDPEQVEFWTSEFGITVETLRILIERHGSRASELRLILGK